MLKYNLSQLGFDEFFISEIDESQEYVPARVTEQHRDIYKIICEEGEKKAKVSGKFSYTSSETRDYPVVGDWVMINKKDDFEDFAVISAVLKRKSIFERTAAGSTNQGQIIAANIDFVFVCMSLNNDFNLRRIERYVSAIWSGSSTPVIVLTKADLCNDTEEKISEVLKVAIGVDVISVSSKTEGGYEKILKYLEAGKTIAFVGSSGVGKSTIINKLIGKEQIATQGLRNDDKGRHTTTHRQMFILPSGTIVIDTPGMRELHLKNADISKGFSDIEDLAKYCKYRDCSHKSEPGCKVLESVKNGELSIERLESYQKLQKENSYEGLDSKQLEHEKIKNMFGGTNAMKQLKKEIKNKRNY